MTSPDVTRPARHGAGAQRAGSAAAGARGAHERNARSYGDWRALLAGEHGPRYRSWAMPRALTLHCVVALAIATPAAAFAEIYRYVQEDGTVLFTTEPRRDLRPTEVYSQPEREPRRPGPASTSPNPNPSRSANAFDHIIVQASREFALPFEFLKAVIRVESAFDPYAVSHAGAQGLMQLMPSTAAALNCADPFDPEQNIMAGARFLRLLSNRYNGDFNLVLAAYNAGGGAVSAYDGIPYEATRRYIERVYQYMLEYSTVASAP